jgi:1,4-dihydroxy-2-naphthoate octaprenyltransferase
MKLTRREVMIFIRLSRPLFLLGGALLFGLGASIASFLGKPIDATLYLFGQGMVTGLQLMAHFLHAYYQPRKDQVNEQQTPISGRSGVLGPHGLPRQTVLYASIASLLLTGTLVSISVAGGRIPLAAWLILILGFLGAFFYSIPPVRLMTSGYGELTTSLLVAGLVPTFAFSLQTGDVHRLLLMSTTPLVALHFSMMIALELPDYASDLKLDRQNITVRLGWSTAMRLHDFAILFAILGFGVAYFNGLPRRVVFGALIALPLAAAQIWQISRIRRGFPTRWRTLTSSALGLFGLMVYLELIGYILS